MKNTRILVPIIYVLVGLGIGFFSGIEYKNYQTSKLRNGFTMMGGDGTQRFTGTRGGNQNGGRMGGVVNGTILSMDDKSLTVKLVDGSSKIVLFSGSAIYTNTTTASQSDLKVGNMVAVIGAPNSDGSVTATSVQINPQIFKPQGSPNP